MSKIPRPWFAVVLKWCSKISSAYKFIKRNVLWLLVFLIVFMFSFSTWNNNNSIKSGIQNNRDLHALQKVRQTSLEKKDLNLN